MPIKKALPKNECTSIQKGSLWTGPWCLGASVSYHLFTVSVKDQHPLGNTKGLIQEPRGLQFMGH